MPPKGFSKMGAATTKPATTTPPSASALTAMRLEDFWAYAPTHQYFYEPCNTLYVAAFIDSHFPPQPVLDTRGQPRRHNGKLVTVRASKWLDRNKWINQLIWVPGLPQIIENQLLDKGGWKNKDGARCLNQYQAPDIVPGEASKAGPWIDHVERIYPDDADHIISFLAHRVQRPGEKINHALVLGGAPGIGKDTLLEPVKHGVGHWNWHEVTPQQLIGRTTEFLKSIVLRINEARDLGEEGGRIDRFGFYDHCLSILVTPPDSLRVNEKYVREYYVANVIALIFTTNYRDALYLPYDGRRHYVAFSESTTADFPAGYFDKLWHWFLHEDGFAHVVAYLASVDLSNFHSKAPPPKTTSFLAMADRGTTPEEAELKDAIDTLENPPALTIAMLARIPGNSFDWLTHPKARRAMPHRLERCGYLPYRNSNAKDGLWRIKKRRQVIYVRTDVKPKDRQCCAEALVSEEEKRT